MAPAKRGAPVATNDFIGGRGFPLQGGSPPVKPYTSPFNNSAITGRPVVQQNIIVLLAGSPGASLPFFSSPPEPATDQFDALVASFLFDDVTIIQDAGNQLPLFLIGSLGRGAFTTLYAYSSSFSTYYSGINKIINPDSSISYGDLAPTDTPSPGQSFVAPTVVRTASGSEPSPQFGTFFTALDSASGAAIAPDRDACAGRALFNFPAQNADQDVVKYGYVNNLAEVEIQITGIFLAAVHAPAGSDVATGTTITPSNARDFFGLK